MSIQERSFAQRVKKLEDLLKSQKEKYEALLKTHEHERKTHTTAISITSLKLKEQMLFYDALKDPSLISRRRKAQAPDVPKGFIAKAAALAYVQAAKGRVVSTSEVVAALCRQAGVGPDDDGFPVFRQTIRHALSKYVAEKVLKRWPTTPGAMGNWSTFDKPKKVDIKKKTKRATGATKK